MLLLLTQWLAELYPERLGFLRVFQYLTLRALLAAMTALLIGIGFGPLVIRRLAELKRRGVRWKDPVQRYKGLGEMDADQLAETTMDPRHRTLRKLTIDDVDEASQVFELLMGSDVAPRKEFIVQGAYEVDVETLDA